VIFDKDFIKYIRDNGKNFKLNNILSIPPKQSGVYVIFHKCTFVYVGQSKQNQGIRERLKNHHDDSHNRNLKTWIKSLNGDMNFSYIKCGEEKIDDLEKSLIRHLKPQANVVHYLNYNPESIVWRRSIHV